MSSVVQLLRELIALPSVNLAFQPDVPEWTGEARVADCLQAHAEKAGLACAWQEVLPGRRNLIVTLPARDRARGRVIFAPHLDTVGVESAKQLKPALKQGRLHGRGACDTKGSVAAMFSAVLEIARSDARPRQTEVLFVGLVDEENAQAGSRAFARRKVKADLAIVGEPTENRLVTAHKGDLWLKLHTRGRAAHGAKPELGDNAVTKAARAVTTLEGAYAQELRARPHPLLGPATISVGMIRGGVQANIVPDHCEIVIDRRTIPGERDAAVRREIVARLRREGCVVELESTKTGICPPLETDVDRPLVNQLMRSLGQRGPLGVDYFCDAAILAAGGIPSVVFGPGNIAQAHTRDEWVAVASLEEATRLLAGFLRELP